MRAVIQRVSYGKVTVDSKPVSEIQKGYVVFVGIYEKDKQEDLTFISNKITGLRINADEKADINASIEDIQGEILLVSQFTLCADTSKGRRPSFMNAMHPDNAEKMYEQLVNDIKKKGIPTKTGIFGAMMNVEIHNDGPVTIIVDSKSP